MNLSFREYVKLNMDKAYNHQQVEVPQVKVKKTIAPVAPAPVKEKDVFDYVKEINPQVWTAKIVQNKKYLFYNGHYLDISKLAKELKTLYTNKGYNNYGFSKLDESELIRYTTVRDIIAKEFNNETNDTELNPTHVAQTLFDNELKDFEWQPQPLILK
jgi:hypothetical protein